MNHEWDDQDRAPLIGRLGLLGSCLSVITYASPLSAVVSSHIISLIEGQDNFYTSKTRYHHRPPPTVPCYAGLIAACLRSTAVHPTDMFQGDVISKKSTASMNFSLSLAYFLVGLEWAVYGKFLGDNFIFVSISFQLMVSASRHLIFWQLLEVALTAFMVYFCCIYLYTVVYTRLYCILYIVELDLIATIRLLYRNYAHYALCRSCLLICGIAIVRLLSVLFHDDFEENANISVAI